MERKSRLEIHVVILIIASILVGPGLASAVEQFPAKPIEFWVGYAAGGANDLIARALAKPMEDVLGQPVVVVNKPGAGGAVAVSALKNAKPDGYTFVITTGTTFTFTPHVQNVDYRLEEFTFLASVGRFQEAYASLSGRPWKTFKELIQYSKKNPGLTYVIQHPLGESIANFIASKEGIDWRAIPTKGTSEVTPAVLGKHVDFGFFAGSQVPFVKTGEMINLVGCGKQRLFASPEVPTLKECGYDIWIDNDAVIAAPKGIADPVAKKLTAAIERATKDPKYVNLLQNTYAMSVNFTVGDDLTRRMHEQYDIQRDLVKQLKK
jgi:tripartite-type tricarboxylate transporter receptor subunit TctC